MLLKAFILSLFTFGIIILETRADFPQLHRALPGANGKPGYRVMSPGHAAERYGSSEDKHGHADMDSKLGKHHNAMDFESSKSEAAVYSIISAILVGLSGIFPLVVIPLEAGPSLKNGAGSSLLKLLLSFAVGSMLGDVFLHLLPESWATVSSATDPHWAHTVVGLWVICGLLCFMVIEKIFMETEPDEDEDVNEETALTQSEEKTEKELKNGITQLNGQANGIRLRNGKITSTDQNGHVNVTSSDQNGHVNGRVNEEAKDKNNKNKETVTDSIQITGYLNLLANCIDNFTHGLAVAGSYLISPKVGLCTTVAILLHEIPHEVGDFAILLRSGFDRWKAAKAQVLTASGGVLGALFAIYSDSAESAGDKTAAILPFTAGGFIYIALVTVVPDLLKEKCPRESLKQMACIATGVLSMMVVTVLFD